MSVPADALPHGTFEGLKTPAAKAGIGIRRDIGGVDRAEWRLNRPPAGIGKPPFCRVATRAVAEAQRLAATLQCCFREGSG